VRLHVNEQGQVGPRRSVVHDIIVVKSLPLATEGINRIAPLSDNYGMFGSVDVLSPSGSRPRLIVGEQKPTVIANVSVIANSESTITVSGKSTAKQRRP